MYNTGMATEMNKPSTTAATGVDSVNMVDNGHTLTDIPGFPLNNNLDSLVADTKLKFIFVGGKGGVGKTTSSAAIATQLSFNRKGKLQRNLRLGSFGIIITLSYWDDKMSSNYIFFETFVYSASGVY